MFNLEWRDVATQTGAAVSDIVAAPYELTGLLVDLDHEFRVQEVVSGVASPFSPWIGFRTTASTGEPPVVVGSSSKVPTRARQFLVGLKQL